jgi:hypothetical protein
MAFIKAPLDVLFKTAGKGIVNGLSRTVGRLLGSGISTDSRIVNAKAKWSGRSDKKDWRVRLQVPEGPLTEFFDFDKNPLLQPLAGSRGMFWPLTPSMVIQHSANYNAMAQTHSNYPFQAYQNSQVDSMNIIGEFPVQNSEDAKHWVATVNFLRTATKMFFGKDEGTGKGLKGNPPPILHLFGYGDHMFHKIPVVLNSFNVELRAGIDYISTRQNNSGYETARTRERMGLPELEDSQTWAPTLSNISVLVTPVYSRESIKKFSLSEFARGELSGKGDGEIGFI